MVKVVRSALPAVGSRWDGQHYGGGSMHTGGVRMVADGSLYGWLNPITGYYGVRVCVVQ